MTHREKVIREAMGILRDISKRTSLRDEWGKIIREGHPEPKDVEGVLNRVYTLAKSKGRREKAR